MQEKPIVASLEQVTDSDPLEANPGSKGRNPVQPIVSTINKPVPPNLIDTTGKTIAELQKRLLEEEAELLRLIQLNAAGPQKTKLEELATNEAQAIRSSGIDALDDQLDKILLKDGSTGLTAFQKKSTTTFDTEIKNGGITNGPAIQNQLSVIHDLRKKMLDQAIDEDIEATKARAYSLLRAHMKLDQPGLVQAKVKGASKNDLLKDIMNSENHMLQCQDPDDKNAKNKVIQYEESSQGGGAPGTLRSLDPVSLGMGMAALGHRSIEVTGSPKGALATARAALASGVLDVSFDPGTKQKIESRSSYRSEYEWNKAQVELRAIENISKQNLIERANKATNRAFNEAESGLSHKAQVLTHLNPWEPGRREMLLDMTVAERAKLAAELRHHSFAQKGGANINGAKLISQVNSSGERDQFQRLFCEQIVERDLPKLQKLNNGDTIAEAILKEKPAIQKAYYRGLDKITDKVLLKDTRVALVKRAINKHFESALKDDDTIKLLGNPVKKSNMEVCDILRDVKTNKERIEILNAAKADLRNYHARATTPEAQQKYDELKQGLENEVTRLNTVAAQPSWVNQLPKEPEPAPDENRNPPAPRIRPNPEDEARIRPNPEDEAPRNPRNQMSISSKKLKNGSNPDEAEGIEMESSLNFGKGSNNSK